MSESENELDRWMTEVAERRQKCFEDQKISNKEMIERHRKRNKLSEYVIGENVLVENQAAKSKRRKKVLGAVPVFDGRVLQRKGNQYKIQYETDIGEDLVNWFPAFSIVASTKARGNLKKAVITRNESLDISTAVCADEDVPPNNEASRLRERLLEFNLVPVETIGDLNCFFRAISRLVYGSDEYHIMVRKQAVERVSDYPEDYQDYLLHDYASVEEYISRMLQNSHWEDDAIIRATADALEVQIHIVSTTSDYISTFNPDSGNPSQTLFLGHISELHYVSTASAHEPQCLQYGGTTSDGTKLSRTEAIDYLVF